MRRLVFYTVFIVLLKQTEAWLLSCPCAPPMQPRCPPTPPCFQPPQQPQPPRQPQLCICPCPLPVCPPAPPCQPPKPCPPCLFPIPQYPSAPQIPAIPQIPPVPQIPHMSVPQMPAHQMPSAPSRPVSTCCRLCVCSFRRKRDLSGLNNTVHEVDPVCNNDQLMIIMEENIGKDATESTFAIKKAADSALKAEFNVFCAEDDLTHVAHTEDFCQHKKGNVICFAYKS